MAVDPRKDAVVAQPYVAPSGFAGGNIPQYLLDQLQRIQYAQEELGSLAPVVTDRPPTNPRIGTIRLPKVSSWDPLGLGVRQMVYWTGTAWRSVVRATEGTWNDPFLIGPTRIWTDGSGNLRRKHGSNPSSDTDGTIIT